MTVKSKKYSFVLFIGFLLLFVKGAYSFVLSILATAKEEEVSVLKALQGCFAEDERLISISWVMIIGVLLVLFLAMAFNNRVLFFLGVLLSAAEFGLYTYRWIHDNKGTDWSWGDMRITGLIYCCIITGLVLLFMLIGAFLLLRAANATGIFTILMRSSIILGILLSITLDVLPFLTKEWAAEKWADTIWRYEFPCGGSSYEFPYNGFVLYIPMAFLVLLIAKWMDLRLDEVAAAKAAKAPAQPAEPEQPAAPEQPVAPEQPAALTPEYTAPAETPAEEPAPEPVEAPAETPAEAPAYEEPAETLVEAPVYEASAEVPAEAAAEPIAEAASDDSAETPIEALMAAYDDSAETVNEAVTEAADTASENMAEVLETVDETVAETVAENVTTEEDTIKKDFE